MSNTGSNINTQNPLHPTTGTMGNLTSIFSNSNTAGNIFANQSAGKTGK